MSGRNLLGRSLPVYEGMTLRDWFAGQVAAESIRNSIATFSGYDASATAVEAYRIADAMLAERERSTQSADPA